MTLVSSRTIGSAGARRLRLVLAPREGEDLLGSELDSSGAAHGREAAASTSFLRGALRLAQHDLAIRRDLELHGAAGLDPEMIAHPFGNGDLAFDSDLMR